MGLTVSTYAGSDPRVRRPPPAPLPLDAVNAMRGVQCHEDTQRLTLRQRGVHSKLPTNQQTLEKIASSPCLQRPSL